MIRAARLVVLMKASHVAPLFFPRFAPLWGCTAPGKPIAQRVTLRTGEVARMGLKAARTRFEVSVASMMEDGVRKTINGLLHRFADSGDTFLDGDDAIPLEKLY
jgi:hypothetical protein